MLGPLTPARLARVKRRLLDPPPGGRIAAAKEFGIDVTLLIEQLRLTPEERVRRLERVTKSLERERGAARKRS